MQWMVAAFLLLIPLISAHPARAAEPVDLTLVLVTDVSRSIDDSEYDLEKHGYADAFTEPHVLADAMTWHPHLIHGLGGEPVVGFPTSRQVVTLHDVEMWRGDSAHRLYGSLLAPVIRSSLATMALPLESCPVTMRRMLTVMAFLPCSVA